MKSRLHRIEIRNFKAFREFSFDLGGRHLLLYGANGSGKSSLYWALYTFLQSARKPTPGVAKYFDPADPQNLLNIHEQNEAAPKPGEIALTLRDVGTKIDTTYRISKADHSTLNHPTILKGDLASDFVTYRFFFGFSNFRNSERFDLWSLFEAEILPFCVSTGGGATPLQQWERIRSGVANPAGSRGLGGADAYAAFTAATNQFADTLKSVVDDISKEAQKFYDQHFAQGDPVPLKLALGVTRPPSFSGTTRQTSQFRKPILELHIEVAGKVIKRPQSFLNEAKMTQLALSVRFAASLVNLHESDLKLLVLDDLLVSLDMSNRMAVVKILLSGAFGNYQKIILTHDLGFFQEIRRLIGPNHSDWLFSKMTGDAKQGPRLESVMTELELAQDYLANDQLTECGNMLRKHAEANLEAFINTVKAKRGLDTLISTDKFTSLANRIAEAKNLLALAGQHEFATLLQDKFSPADLAALLSPDEIDPAKFAALPKAERGKIIAKLMAARTDLEKNIIEVLSDSSRKRLNAIRLLNEVEKIKDRILNPASHAGVAPIYSKEAQDAVKIIQALETALAAALAAL